MYPPLTTGGFNTGALANLNLQTAQSAPQATSTGAAILNLPANTATPTVAPFNPTNPLTYNESTSTTVYDSLGNAYPGTFYFAQAPAPANPGTWDTYMTVNGTQVGGVQVLQFTTAGAVQPQAVGNGGLLTFAGFNPPSGATGNQSFTFDFSKSTQYGGSFGVSTITQNGYATGQLARVAIDTTGVVSAVYTNGRSTQLGQLAMSNFPNPQGLTQLGDTNWSQTFSSGTVVQGTAGAAGFGSIQAGALESSNVDLTSELVNMITAQRNFDANAQVITTANNESKTIINIQP